ncbi:hypothetical protein IFR05_002451 [Cadophora sp. M221]|nr:hypothetical protein IFR05_002451 [Cadophora sp. M221]
MPIFFCSLHRSHTRLRKRPPACFFPSKSTVYLDLINHSLLYNCQSDLDYLRTCYGPSVDILLTPYNGEPSSVHGDDDVPWEATASPIPLSTQQTNFASPEATSGPTSSGSWSPYPGSLGATNDTSPSTAIITPSSQDQNAAALTMPEAAVQDDDVDSVAQVPAPIEFRCPHCPEIKPSRALLNRHINTHTRPYACHCGVNKATQRDLDRHQDTHGKIRRYFCPVAGCPWNVHGIKRGFSRRLDNAKRHLKSHDNHATLFVLREDSQGRLSRV